MRPHRAFLPAAILITAISCHEMIADPWTAELPEGSVQMLVDSDRRAEFRNDTRDLPLRTDLVVPERFVVRDRASWETFWQRTRSTRAAPFVNFDTEMVVVVAIGRVAPPWEEVAIAGVMANGAEMYVLVYRSGSNPECVPTPKTFFDPAPFAVSLVPKRPGNPRYLERLQAIPSCI